MNTVALMGRLTADPKCGQSGETRYARFSLAVDRRGKDAGTDFISCVCFGKTAENAEKWLKKGTKITTEGRIQTGSYTNKEGHKVYTTDVILTNWEFAEAKKQETENEETKAAGIDGFMNIPDEIGEELPFQ